MAMLLRTLAIATAVAMLFNMAMAANYDVTWDLVTSGSQQAWANGNKFVVGDTLTFLYGPTHSVLIVSKPDYDACLTNGSLASYSGGNTVISLSSIGSTYLICGVPGHCDRGMKMVINTLAAPPPPPGTPSVPPTATPPSATPSIPTTPGSSPTVSPGSSPVVAPAPKTAAPTKSPKISPSVSPSKSPVISPSKSPAKSPPSAPPPATESPATPPIGASPPSAANKINAVAGFTIGVGFIIMMLLTL